MPGRQSHGGAPSKKAKTRAPAKKKGLDAFAIASHEHPDDIKIRKHRLGATEGGGRPRKRQHDEDEDSGEDNGESSNKKQRKGTERGRFDELDMIDGSDSEGHEWKLGEVDSDDDSDLDSDEAFGESDEERFADFGFSGSSSHKKAKKPQSSAKNLNLDEDDDNADSDSELEEGDLGDQAVDLATMLDATDESDGDIQGREGSNGADSTEEDDDDDETEDSDDESSVSSADEDETSDQAKNAELQDLIASLPQAEESKQVGIRQSSAQEFSKPSNFGLTSKTKLTLEDLSLPAIRDPNIKKSLKLLDTDANGEAKRKGSKALGVPLAKRQQDRLDRSAAYEKTKETLDRWTDTVKHNRRADHLIFPLPDPDVLSAHQNNRLQSTMASKPFNELEAAIQNILEESGLATENGRDDEDRIREFEDLEAKKMTAEEVKARRDQLRMARELLFREEAKSKRIKKIKSKSYRKVHRKQREKEERLHQQALIDGGYVPSEDELEAQDRRRATERMGAKHRASKWAKATKETGRAAWDEDARAGVIDMARRDEELRKRVEGRAVRKEFENDSEGSVSGTNDDDSEALSDEENTRLLRELKDLGSATTTKGSGPGSKLANMQFMLKAEANRKKENDAIVEEMRRELAGEDPPSEDEEEIDIGRRAFGLARNKDQDKVVTRRRDASQEPLNSIDEDEEIDAQTNFPGSVSKAASKNEHKIKTNRPTQSLALPTKVGQLDTGSEGGAWSKATSNQSTISNPEATRRRHARNNAIDVEELDVSQAAVLTTKSNPKKSSKNSTTLGVSSDESDDDSPAHLPFAIRDQELIKRAFAGADVVGEFEAEKRQTIEDEDEKIVDNTLPGWGSWTGDGLSKKERARNKGRFLTKTQGIREQNRKDAKLDRVIINEKRVKKNEKFLAPALPHPFESRQQYERSLRLPVGPEWGTKETFQDATKPRVLVKQGIIAPMSKPLL